MADPRLYDALRKADAAGDTEGAKRLADYIRSQPSEAAPAEPKPAAPEVGAPEAAFLGAGDVATGGLMDKMLGGFAAADAATQMAHGLKAPEDAEKTYREVVPEAQARREAAFEQHPTPYRVGEGAGFLGTGGAQLIKGMFGLGKAAPAAIRSLGTPEGWKAAAMGAAKGMGIGGAYGAASGAGHSDAPDWYGLMADTAKGAGAGMASGALVGAPMGVGSAALDNEAGRAAGVAGESRDQALLLAGLEGKQRTLGGGRRAREAGQAIYDEELPDGKRLIDELVSKPPAESLSLTERLRQSEGKVLGGVRDRLSQIPGAGVDPVEFKTALAGQLENLPSEAQAAVAKEIDRMVDSRTVDGILPAGGVRSVIEELQKLSKFGAPNLQGALGDKNAQPFQRMYGPATDAEKGLVAKHLPDDQGAFDEALRKYGIFDKAAMGADVKMQRENKGRPAVKLPDKEPGLVGKLAEKTPMVGPWIKTVRQWRQMVPGAQKLPSQLEGEADAAEAQLAKWAPVFEKAMKEGPRAVALIHSVLLAQNPDYRDAFKSQQVNVTAHEETDVAAAPPAEKPAAPESADIVSSPEMDALALEHFRRNPQKAHAWSETGWLMQKNNPDDPERNAMSAPIHGEETEVPFRWTPSKDHVTATVHTHPNKMGARDLNQKNRSASSRDSDLVTKGHVPAYVLGTDNRVRILEMRNGKIAERMLDGQD